MGRNAKQTGSRDDRSAESPDLIAIDGAKQSISDRSLVLKDKDRGRVWLTLRNGVVVGAMGSEPERFMGLPESSARHLARYGAIPAPTARYRVDLVIVAQGYMGPSHTFTSRAAAERFARAISFYLPAAASGRDLSPAWVLVYALPIPGAHPYRIMTNGLCYLCFDANGVTVKRHEISGDHFGAKESRRASIGGAQ